MFIFKETVFSVLSQIAEFVNSLEIYRSTRSPSNGMVRAPVKINKYRMVIVNTVKK